MRAENPEAFAKARRDYYLKNKVRINENSRRNHLRKAFGITPEEYDRLITEQNGLCGICGEPMARVCIDHCHSSGKIRKMLCHNCNVLLGHARDSVIILQQAIDYLNKFSI